MHAEATPLLLTKLGVPPPRPPTLYRARLFGLASAAPGTRLVLVSAPAGFGKTTFLATWCHVLAAQRQTAVAWLALDEGDNDPARFLAYLCTALAQAAALPDDLGSAPLWPGGEGAADSTIVLARLINALATLDRDVVLVLDDYHRISAPAVHVAVAFLLDHLPDRACLAIGSRADPPLQLARLRVHAQLVELRAADLRFTPEEIQAFMQAAGNLDLTPEEVREIDACVEGWPAGVQLMALALRADAAGEAAEAGTPRCSILDRLASSQRHVFDYLASEIFEQQAPAIRRFLLQTAVLDRLSGPLCDTVLGSREQGAGHGEQGSPGEALVSSPASRPWRSPSQSQEVLEELERANLFVIPLDGERRWYRYHHLFHAFLCARLEQEAQVEIAELHRRAGAWYACHGLQQQAVEHALAAGEGVRAAEMIEGLALALIERGDCATLRRWLEQIPRAVLEARPALGLWAAWAALLAGEVDRIEPLLQRAGRAWLAADDRRGLGEVAHLQAHLARLRGDADGTIRAAQQALAQLSEEDLTLRAGSLLALGAGQLLAGDLAAAGATLAEAHARCQAHNFLGMLVALVCAGDLAAAQGKLHTAAARYQAAVQAAGSHTLCERWAAEIRLGDLARERNELDQALSILQAALGAAEHAGVAVYLPAGYVSLARTLWARGDLSAAGIAFDRALDAAHRLESLACVRQVHAYSARLALAQGNLAPARRWQMEAALDPAGDLPVKREVEALTLARVLIAQGRCEAGGRALDKARTLLERLRQAAEAQGRVGSLVEILALAALAEAAAGRREAALRTLHQGVALAMLEGYARIFLDEGTPMVELLRAAYARGIAPAYVARLLGASPEAQSVAPPWHEPASVAPWHDDQDRLRRLRPGGSRGERGAGQGDEQVRQAQEPRSAQLDATSALRAALERSNALIEPLSERELEVLRLIADGASNQAIADLLVISIGTVKSHINHILGKLAARSRTEAVAHARELGLLDLTAVSNFR